MLWQTHKKEREKLIVDILIRDIMSKLTSKHNSHMAYTNQGIYVNATIKGMHRDVYIPIMPVYNFLLIFWVELVAIWCLSTHACSNYNN